VKRFALKDLKFYPATPSRWRDVEKLFGERGACGGCWCMYLRLSNSTWTKGKTSGANKRAFKRVISAGEKPGVIAYLGREPIGWCAVAPRKAYPRLARSRVMAPVDDKQAWAITCLFIQKSCRRKGVSARLLKAAAEHAGRYGAEVVEGYPVEATMEKMPDPFLWHGTPSAFRRAGFREVARRSKSRVVMRRRPPTIAR
jgi:GNAT superfamily N-acetyltransferase